MIAVEFFALKLSLAKYSKLIFEESNSSPENMYITHSEMTIELYHLIASTIGANKLKTNPMLYFLSEDGVDRTRSYILEKYYHFIIESLLGDMHHNAMAQTTNIDEYNKTATNILKIIKNIDSAENSLTDALRKSYGKHALDDNFQSLNIVWQTILDSFETALSETWFSVDKVIAVIKPVFAKSNKLIKKILQTMISKLDILVFDKNVGLLLDRYFQVTTIKHILSVVDSDNTIAQTYPKKIYLVCKTDPHEMTDNQQRMIESLKKEIPEIVESIDCVEYAYNLVIIRGDEQFQREHMKLIQGPVSITFYRLEYFGFDFVEHLDSIKLQKVKKDYERWSFRRMYFYPTLSFNVEMVIDLDNNIETKMKQFVMTLANERKEQLLKIVKSNSHTNLETICNMFSKESLIGEGVHGRVYSTSVDDNQCVVKSGRISFEELRQLQSVSKLVEDDICSFFPLVVAMGVCAQNANDIMHTSRLLTKINYNPVIKETFDLNDNHFVVMERGEQTLTNLRLNVFEIDVWSRLFCQAFFAMFCMRKYTGLVHADLHLDNIMVDVSQNIMLIDLGICASSYNHSFKCFAFLGQMFEDTDPDLYPSMHELLSRLMKHVHNARKNSTFSDKFEWELMAIAITQNNKTTFDG